MAALDSVPAELRSGEKAVGDVLGLYQIKTYLQSCPAGCGGVPAGKYTRNSDHLQFYQ